MSVTELLERPTQVAEGENVEIRGFDVPALKAAFERGLCVTGVQKDQNGGPVYELGPVPYGLGNADREIGAHFDPEAQGTFFDAGFVGVGVNTKEVCGRPYDWMDMASSER